MHLTGTGVVASPILSGPRRNDGRFSDVGMRLGGVDGVWGSGRLLDSSRGICTDASTISASEPEGRDGSGSDFVIQWLVVSG